MLEMEIKPHDAYGLKGRMERGEGGLVFGASSREVLENIFFHAYFVSTSVVHWLSFPSINKLEFTAVLKQSSRREVVVGIKACGLLMWDECLFVNDAFSPV